MCAQNGFGCSYRGDGSAGCCFAILPDARLGSRGRSRRAGPSPGFAVKFSLVARRFCCYHRRAPGVASILDTALPVCVEVARAGTRGGARAGAEREKERYITKVWRKEITQLVAGRFRPRWPCRTALAWAMELCRCDTSQVPALPNAHTAPTNVTPRPRFENFARYAYPKCVF